MSKTIYLDGTETLVFTRMLAEPDYSPYSPLNRWEILLLNAIMKAGIFPGQLIVIRYEDFDRNFNRWPDFRSIRRTGTEILNALGLRHGDLHQFEVLHQGFSIEFRGRGLRPSPDYERITLPPWPTTNSIP